jgi:hypothetical protein
MSDFQVCRGMNTPSANAPPGSAKERLRNVGGLARPVSLADEQVLPVLPALESILPTGGLQRGLTLVVEGNTGASSLALALLAGATGAGSWAASVGMPALGMASAAELGVVLEHLILISTPAAKLWPTVIAALIDAFDVVLVEWPGAQASVARRLGQRARERRAVLISVLSETGTRNQAWSEAADLRLTVTAARWQGLEWGHGRLESRLVLVETGGRRSARSRKTVLWLPNPEGRVAVGDARAFDAIPVEEPATKKLAGLDG